MVESDILKSSKAWERISSGVPQGISDIEIRRMFHDYAQVLTVLVNSLDRLMDEADRLDGRVDRRASDQSALEDRLFDPERGLLVKLREELRTYVDTKVGRLTAMGLVIMGGVVTGSIMFAVQRIN